MTEPQSSAGEAATIYDDLRFGEGDARFEASRRSPAFPFRFQFSLWQLLVAMTCAALLIGLVRILGGPAHTATALGFLVLIGLMISAIGVNPPEILVLGWWLILVLYVLFSIVAMLGVAFAA